MKNKVKVQDELNELWRKIIDPLTNLDTEGPALFARYTSLSVEAGDLGQKGDEIFDKMMATMKTSIMKEIKIRSSKVRS